MMTLCHRRPPPATPAAVAPRAGGGTGVVEGRRDQIFRPAGTGPHRPVQRGPAVVPVPPPVQANRTTSVSPSDATDDDAAVAGRPGRRPRGGVRLTPARPGSPASHRRGVMPP